VTGGKGGLAALGSGPACVPRQLHGSLEDKRGPTGGILGRKEVRCDERGCEGK